MFVELVAVALISAQSVDNWWLGQVKRLGGRCEVVRFALFV